MKVTEGQHGEVNAAEKIASISQEKGVPHTMQGHQKSIRAG